LHPPVAPSAGAAPDTLSPHHQPRTCHSSLEIML
jgi:hypothetical protein